MDNHKQLLSVKFLGIRRSERWLFRNLSFTLSAGEVMQIVGQNGSGKTSLLRSICGLLDQREGDIEWCHTDDVSQSALPIFLGHLPAVKAELSVYENLKYHPLGGQFFSDQLIDDAIDQVGLSYYGETLARKLSAGQTRRVGLARLLLAETKCWVLDEPFTSLDVEGCAWLETKITEFVQKGGAVLLTSHQAIHLEQSPRILEIVTAESDAQESIC